MKSKPPRWPLFAAAALLLLLLVLLLLARCGSREPALNVEPPSSTEATPEEPCRPCSADADSGIQEEKAEVKTPPPARTQRRAPIEAASEGVVRIVASGMLQNPRLYVDDVLVGVLPLQTRLAAGSHRFRVVLIDGTVHEETRSVRFTDPSKPAELVLERRRR